MSMATAAAGVVLVFALFRGSRGRDVPLAVCAAAGLSALGAVVFGTPLAVLGSLPTMGGRYVFLPWVLMMWVLVLLLDRGHRAAVVPLMVAAALAVHGFVLAPRTRYDWMGDAACLESRAACHVVVNPGWGGGLPGRGAKP
jgi:hypothetical protein